MANNIPLSQAIKSINPDAAFKYNEEDIDSIEWLNDTTPISKTDILAKQTELQAEYDAEEWKRNRQAEYPSHDDCIHALLDGGDTLTDLQAKRSATKNKYPKPE
tara:strand:- start:21 stop:332 length:312 start_codon:yes stop_codon:yes gene_type:complete